MYERLQGLLAMFYPLIRTERQRWARVFALPEPEYLSALEAEAVARGLTQVLVAEGNAVAWVDGEGQELLLLFRLYDPRDLAAVRSMYETVAAHDAPLAYAFVHQTPDGVGTWDIFHMSRLTYLSHCNRVSGPGADGDA
jgi:hypothetical protein